MYAQRDGALKFLRQHMSGFSLLGRRNAAICPKLKHKRKAFAKQNPSNSPLKGL
jgi:hypothetical protein